MYEFFKFEKKKFGWVGRKFFGFKDCTSSTDHKLQFHKVVSQNFFL